jgi:hypothetical protein
MPKFNVTMMALATMYLQVEIEAENKEQAEVFAKSKAPSDPGDWQIEPETPIHEVEVTEAELIEEDDDDVEETQNADDLLPA